MASRPYHLEQLALLCRTHPTAPKYLFVPTPQIGSIIGSALAASGTSWVNLRMITARDHALALAEPVLAQRGLRELATDEDLFLIAGLLDDTVLAEGAGYFEGAEQTPGLLAAFSQTITAVRQAGLGAAEIRSALRKPKGEALARLVAAYEEMLDEHRLYDDATVFTVALEVLSGNPASAHAIYAILDETPLSALAHRFVTALTGGALRRVGRPRYGQLPPRTTASGRFDWDPSVESLEPAPGGRLLDRDGIGEAGDRLSLRIALGAENEVRGIIREIIEHEIPIDTVEIAYTVDSPYLTLLVDATDRLGIPATFAGGIPASLTPPGQALAGYFSWILGGLDAAIVIELCRAQLMRLPWKKEGRDDRAPIRPYELATRMQSYRIGRGPKRYRSFAESVVADAETFASEHPDDETAVDFRRRAAGLMASTVELLLSLAPASNTITVADAAANAVRFLTELAPARSERDRAAVSSLVGRLEDIAQSVQSSGRPERIIGWLAQSLSGHKFHVSVPKPGHLAIAPVNRAGYSGRRHFYLAGLDEASFPGLASEDPILLDEERLALSDELELLRERPGANVWSALRALGMAAGHATLVANERDTAEGRELFPSPLYQQAVGLLRVELKSIEPWSAIPRSIADALDGSEEWIVRGAAEARSAIETGELATLAAGREATTARRSVGLGPHHGVLGVEIPADHAVAGGAPLSASQLESLAACPYRYFLDRVLGLRPPEEISDDPAIWLDAATFGTTMHEIFREAMELIRDSGTAPDPKRHGALIDGIIEARVEALAERIPPPNDGVLQATRNRMLRAGRVFVNAEARRADVADPVGFEVSFGRDDDAAGVEINLGDGLTVKLRGQIDRVDRRKDYGHLEIWDYKTGSASKYEDSNLINKGTRLQWALYALAAKQIFAASGEPVEIASAGYYFPTDRGNGRRVAAQPPSGETLGGYIGPLLRMARGGYFPRVQRVTGQCTWCGYNRICGSESCKTKDLKPLVDELGDTPYRAAIEAWCAD